MKKHILALSVIHLLLGYSLAALFIIGHIAFFSESADSLGSVLNDAKSSYQIYFDYFAQHDIYPPFTLALIIASLLFGHGLLRRWKFAWWLGLGLAALNGFSSLRAIIEGQTTLTVIIQGALTIYTLWVLLSDEARTRLNIKTEKETTAG